MKSLFRQILVGCILLGMSGCGKEIKVWTETYEDGEIKTEYQYYHHPQNGKRIKEGWYNTYYPNGADRENGTYKGNVRNGEWKFYTDGGNIKQEETYKDDKLNGKSIEYDENGKIRWEEAYKDGKLEGKSIWYSPNGNIFLEKTYKDGECVRGDCP